VCRNYHYTGFGEVLYFLCGFTLRAVWVRSYEMDSSVFLITVIAIATTIVKAEAKVFSDVSNSHWANSSIQNAVGQGILKGYGNGTFGPDRDITRAEFVTILTRMIDAESNSSSYSDVQGHWAEDAIASAKASGIVGHASTFRPNASLSRKTMAVWVAKALGVENSSYNQAFADSKTALLPFTDHKQFKGADQQGAAVAFGTGIMKGFPDDSFKPGETTTRAEVASVIQRFQNVVKKSPDSFDDLNELIEVSITGTNIITRVPEASIIGGEFEEVRGKEITLKNNIGVDRVLMNIFLTDDSIYRKMFLDIELEGTLPIAIYKNHFTTVSVDDEWSYELSYGNALGFSGFLVGGSRIDENLADQFNYKTRPLDISNFYKKSKQNTFWTINYLRDGGRYSITTDNGSEFEIAL
ncbi:S-layer homology domain-containing protein, partial [Aureibacillus halotolerans]